MELSQREQTPRARARTNHTFISFCSRATRAPFYTGTLAGYAGYLGKNVSISMVIRTGWGRRQGDQMGRLLGHPQGRTCGWDLLG